ncbi:MAG: sensor histidine kinase, partial [Flavobacteriales bacterium]|nr:sensor histidine kinase [Flavobacteriales bacterium]
YRLRSAWKDSIFTEERSVQVAELKERYESGKKDAELERNRATLEQNAFEKKALGAGALLLLLAGVFAFRAYRIRKRSSEQLAQKNAVIEQALKEKELLLREIHHRVKNNLQVISSLLSIQSRGITDLKAREAVRDSRDRVKSMALIHQDLYKEDDLTGIDLPTYVNKLARSLVSSHQLAPEQITLSTNVEPLVLDVDTAIPLGLILNELLTNALKYAFPEGRPGRLWITIREANDQLHVEVRDDGVGYDPNAERGEESS